MSGISLTEVHVHIPQHVEGNQNPLLGFARIVLNGAFVVNGIRIIKSRQDSATGPQRRPHIAFPREKDPKGGTPRNICFPISKALHDLIQGRILEQYDAQVMKAIHQ